MNNNINKQTWLFTSIFFILIAFLLFYHLDVRTFRMWDEARLAVNSANMFIDKNYFYASYQHAPDFWNSKPHLLILLQVLSMKLFGFTEGSVRLPSAIAALLSCGLLYYWVKKELGSQFFAALAVLVFLCTAFIFNHGARAGDYDSLLILWELCYCYAIFEYIKTEQPRLLWLGFIALTLAVLTKSVAALLLILGLFIYVLYKRKLGIFLKLKSFYGGLFVFIFCVAGYYGLHEFLTPGYLHNVYLNEVGRFSNIIEQHDAPPYFYIKIFSLLNFYFFPILLLEIIYLFFNLTIVSKNNFLQYSLIVSVTFFITISLSKTKIIWYAYPIYPFIGIFVAIVGDEMAQRFKLTWRRCWMALLVVWMVVAYVHAILAILDSTREPESLTYYLKHNLNYNAHVNYKMIVDDVTAYDGSTEFYMEKYFAMTHHHLEKITLDQVKPGDWVIMNDDQKNKLTSRLHVGVEDKKGSYGVYLIKTGVPKSL